MGKTLAINLILFLGLLNLFYYYYTITTIDIKQQPNKLIRKKDFILPSSRGNDKLINKTNNLCEFNNRIIGVGLTKTGTTSLTRALVKLGFPYYGHTKGYLMGVVTKDSMFQDETVESEWNENLNNNRGSDRFKRSKYVYELDYGYTASDTPWLFLFQSIDQLYPGAKYVLTLRKSIFKAVESDLKMLARIKGALEKDTFKDLVIKRQDDDNKDSQLLKEKQIEQKKNVLSTQELDEIYKPIGRGWASMGYLEPIDWVTMALLLARRYHLHNENVRLYFKNDPERLLEICFECLNDDIFIWDKLKSFLNCPKAAVFGEFPKANSKGKHANNANVSNGPNSLLTKDLEFLIKNWKQFTFIYALTKRDRFKSSTNGGRYERLADRIVKSWIAPNEITSSSTNFAKEAAKARTIHGQETHDLVFLVKHENIGAYSWYINEFVN